MQTHIRMAGAADIKAVLAIYRSLVGTPGCTWGSDYPNIEDVTGDVNANALFVLCDAPGDILGAIAVCEDDIGHLPCWNKQIKKPCLLARLGVRVQEQGKGRARQLMRFAEQEAEKRGCDGIRFLVSPHNPRALRLYDSLGYRSAGETRMFDIDWLCYEKRIPAG